MLVQKNSPFSHKLFPLGDRAVTIELGQQINEEVHLRVKKLHDELEKHPFPGMKEMTLAFTTLTVYYDPLKVWEEKKESPYQQVCSYLEQAIQHLDDSASSTSRLVEIPVCYGGEFGPDLEEVAKFHGLTPEEVIRIHTETDYLVYMIGFAPGFPYLGGMSPKIATPRRSSPRLSIPAGSVGIAGSQTGVYPISTPGGWQIIGRTPLLLFHVDRNPPSLLQAGDRVRFRAMGEEEFYSWREGV
ncbi:5-oxoprolinase subunit PxpB [Thermoflavimicrobium dichotomicum]|uniref:Inhibitor of KinA n=1 Tax=Thermoflavimicrobium dichotomicum TaxID=46223 RepID=A0A1I3L4D5_9BACL|nr:5-oxoprolinase subunit PxpB [Thermoflavimicrobium dichotomicum]SFI79573.1 inhibitor of KinA [Thermoflavimicrobium dichotomicum]